MKAFLFIPLLISTVLGGFLSGLNREFDEIDLKMVDIYVTMPTSEVNNLIKMAQVSSFDVQSKGAKNIPDFKYENASAVVKWNGNSKTYDKVTFKTGGMYGRSYDKVGYNLKFDKKFLGRKSFKLRPDSGDASKIRSKLSCDIANRLGLPSIQGSYARLYMNNEFWGLYVFMDAIKTSWIKNTFNPTEKEVTTLYQCKNGGFNFTPNSAYTCVNANDDYQHMSQFSSFVNSVANAKDVKELEKIMDVKVFLKYLAMEWLIGSFDHFLWYGHNFNWYKREGDGKWVVIYYDYDNTFGNGASASLWASKGANQDGSGNNRGNNPVNYTFADWEKNIPVIKKLVYNNKSQFKQIVYDVLVQAFNPDILNPRISELKHFLSSYIKEDSTAKNGKLPGRINNAGSKTSLSISSFEYNIENNLKNWIKTKFDVACSNYGFNKSQILSESSKFQPKPFDYSYGALPKTTTTTTTTTSTTTTTIKKTTTTTTSVKPTTTTTSKPETTTTTTTSKSSQPTFTPGKRYDIIKNGSGKISSEWDNWSWGVEDFKFDKQGVMVNYVTASRWGAVSFKRNDKVELGSGVLFFKARTNDTDAIIQVLVHPIDGETINVGNIEKISTTKMVNYGVQVDLPAGTKFNRISIQDGTNNGVILCLDDVYFMDGASVEVTTTKPTTTTTTIKSTSTTTVKLTTTTTTTTKKSTTTTTTTVKPSPTGTRYDIIKGRFVSPWEDWSWGIGSYKFNSDGTMVNNMTKGSWAALSIKNNGVRLGNGILYFKARAAEAGSSIQILVHAINEDFISIQTIENLSTTKMIEYSIPVQLKEGVKFNRVTIQDGTNNGLTLYISDVYYLDGAVDQPTTTTTTVKPTTTTTTTKKSTTTTTTSKKSSTTTTTTKKNTTTTTVKPTATGARYDIINNSKINNQWNNWSWGIETTKFDSQGNMVNTINAGEWGAVSLKKTGSGKLGSGVLYFKAKVNDDDARIQVIVHTGSADDDYISFGDISGIPTNKMNEYAIEIDLEDNVKFDRITLQDNTNEGVILTLNDVYFIEYDGVQTKTTTTKKSTTTTKKSTTTTTVKPTSTGTRYNIINSSGVTYQWDNWSWGVKSYKFNTDGSMVNTISAGEWGAVSFKRTDNVKLGAGVLHLKAKVNVASALIQVLVHTIDDEFVSFGNLRNIPTNKLNEYTVVIDLANGVKFDRITIQDATNEGVTLTLSDVYFIEGATNQAASTTTKKTTTTVRQFITPNGECTEVTQGYYPCGGLNYPDASPCCEQGFRCEYINDYYSMCALVM